MLNKTRAALTAAACASALVGAANSAAAYPAVRLPPPHPASKESPFSCDRLALSPADRHRHFEVLAPLLRGKVNGVRELPDGYEFRFPSDSATFQQVTEFMDRERVCCPFFDLSVRVDREGAGGVWFRLTGRPGTKDFINADFSPWMKRVRAAS